MNRRTFVGAGMLAAAQSGLNAQGAGLVVVDPKPLFDVSPYFYLQFMEPLGVTDSSVEAAWDYDTDDWRKDFIDVVRYLAPDTMRFGGLYSRYYKWREGVGEPARRPWTRNYVWGGKETNRVGTREFVDFCRRVGAEPLYCVNFLSDGEARFRHTPEGDRTGDAREAADWVSYANDPDKRERRAHGVREPYNIKLWQLGNETSYGDVTFNKDQSIAHTIEFAKAIKERDKSVKLIGWGDRHGNSELWARDLIERAGEHLDLVAIHMMGQSPKRPDTVLKGLRYQKEPERAWSELLELADNVERRVSELEHSIEGLGDRCGIAITEGHLSLVPGNANPILTEWLSAVYHARSFNIYQRHGARVKMAIAADFQGTRWTVNAVMHQVPRGVSYLMPVASVAQLFKAHGGRQGVRVASSPSGLDVAATRTGNRIFLHVVNVEYGRAVEAAFAVEGMVVKSAKAHWIAPDDLRQAVSVDQPQIFRPTETALPSEEASRFARPSGTSLAPQAGIRWRVPPGCVAAVELECA